MRARIEGNGTTAYRRRVFEICARCEERIHYYITVNQGLAWTRRQPRKKQFKFCHLCLAELWDEQRERLKIN